MADAKTLAERIAAFEFHPEVYLYPTPRMYAPLEGFSPAEAEFTVELDVYVHIPFCRQVCSFCGYLKTIDSETLRAKYVDAILGEIALRADILAERTITTLHFGGGTPSLLPPKDLERILSALLDVNPQLLDTSLEVSIEATPESVSFEKFSAYKSLGVNRVSMGVQSLDDVEIALSGRHNLSAVSLDAITMLRKVGIPNIVLDLMIGIEGQSAESFEASVRGVLSLRPETVELYALGLMPQTRLGRRTSSQLMSSQDIYRCYEIGRSLFLEAGYGQDAYNRYALPGKGSFLQEDHVLHGKSLLGFGAGARSYAKNIHWRNAYDATNPRQAILEYIQDIHEGRSPVRSGIFLSEEERMRQYVIGHIEALDTAAFREKFGVPFEERFGPLLGEMEDSGLVWADASTLRLTPRGLLFRDSIAQQFFSKDAKRLEAAYRPIR